MTASDQSERVASVLVVGVGTYDEPGLDRPAVEAAAHAFVRLYGDTTHVEVAPCLIGKASVDEVLTGIGRWGDRSVGLLLWTGHAGLDDGGSPFLYASNRKFSPEDLGRALAELEGHGMREWVVILDCCYGYTAGAPIFSRLDNVAGRTPDSSIAVITSTDALDEADAGKFTTQLVEVLTVGPDQKWWSRRQRFLDLGVVLDRLADRLDDKPLRRTGGIEVRELIPNPKYVATSIAEGSIDEAHFLPKARGIEAGESGWYFTGRHHALKTILTWLHSPYGGVFVVTGTAGTGKSALLGRIITLSVPQYRDAAPPQVLATAPVPDVGDVQLAFHAREKRVADLLRFLATGLGVTDYADISSLYEPLRNAVARREGRGYVIAVDALDEAVGDHGRRMVNELLNRIAGDRGVAGVKVLIGSRPGVVGWQRAGVPDEQIYDLDTAPDSRSDLTSYVMLRLRTLDQSPYADATDDAVVEIARAVANASMSDDVGSFLVARVISKTLAASESIDTHRDGWKAHLPRGLGAAFEKDLSAYGRRHDTGVEQLIRDHLEGLAWEEGQGIPRRLIPVFTEAVTGRRYDDDSITQLLTYAGGHITEVEQDGWAMYRLYHERFREHLRAVTHRGHETLDAL